MSVIFDQCQNSSKTTFVKKKKESLAQQSLALNVMCLHLSLDTAKSWEVHIVPEQKVPLIPCESQVMKS